MESKRQAEVFRAFIKDKLREKGLRFDLNMIRDIGREGKEFNERHKLNPPLTTTEFLEFYLELIKEIAQEHIETIEERIAKLKR
jgi:hypothetical protein